MQRQLEEKREQAARLRREAETSQTANDRAFFSRQARRLDHQVEELESLSFGSSAVDAPVVRSMRLEGQRVLVVEDDFITGELLRISVERAGGSVIGPVADGRLAIAFAARHPPDAALLDVSLADGNSVELARYLGEHRIPYAVLTGHPAAALPTELRSAPHLEKPVAPRVFEEMLAQLLTEHPAHAVPKPSKRADS
jgi:CheY-like chemotaxis protein